MIRRLMFTIVCVLCAGTSQSWAQTFEKGWIDVNFGAATAAQDEFSSTRIITVSQEAGGGSIAYSLPRGGSFDVSGGYMFTKQLGLGVSLAGTAHEDTAGLAISIPHPLFFNSSALDATVTNGTLMRAEGAWHIDAMLIAVQTPRVRLRVFGGPSYFRAEQDVVGGIKYDQVFQLFGRGNVVDITSYDTETSVGTGWGAHAGVDVAVFFTRVFGLGANVRVSRGSVEIDDYGGAHTVKAGGVQSGGGLRLKF